MTRQEFQRRYHNYADTNKASAEAEARRVNAEGVDGYEVVVYGPLLGKYCLMLDTAAEFVATLGIVDEDAAR